MGVLDKFLDIIKMTDDDDYEDDYFDDDYEDEDYVEKPKKSLFSGNKKSKPASRSAEAYDDEPEEDYGNGNYDDSRSSAAAPSGNSKVTPMPRTAARRARGNMEVCVIKPNTVDDQREIAETLLSGRTVILNLEGLDVEIAQRIIDFTSGAAFAIGGNLQKISNFIFLVTPNNVEISGDLQDLLNTSFDNSSMRTRF